MIRRPRRLRATKAIRNLVRETKLQKEDLIYPLFIVDGENIKREIPSMEGVYHFSVDMLEDEIKELKEKLTNESINYEKVNYLKSENERFKNEIINITEEKKEYKEYSNSLNERIQEVLLNKSIEIAKINEEKNNLIREIESKKEIELKNANDIINSLKDEIFELKLNLNKIILEVYKKNINSFNLCKKIGFKVVKEKTINNKQVFLMELNKNKI